MESRMNVEKLKFRSPQAALRSVRLRMQAFSPPTEKVPVGNAVGRVLAEDIKSTFDIPGFTRPWVDGYATKAKWTEGASAPRPVVLSLVGKLFPEDYPTDHQLGNREAFFAACGSPLPSGADCVIRAEDATVTGSEVHILREAARGDGLSHVGEDIRKGSLLVRKHRIIGPQDIGLIVAVGRSKVVVFQKPKLAILSVGNEIVGLDNFAANRIINNYAYVISAAATELGVQPISLGIARDDTDDIAAKLSNGVRISDAVVTVAGCSVGPRDLVPAAVRKLGEVAFHGVRIKPGHVAGAGVVNGKPVFMLPGHISSCTMAFYVFVVPTLARLAGTKPSQMLPTIRAESNTDVEKASAHTFLRLRLTTRSGRLLAEPIHGGTNIMSSLSKANGFALIPPNRAIRKGQEINVTLFSRLEHARFS
jgi:molybdopterin molybdotransferase